MLKNFLVTSPQICLFPGHTWRFPVKTVVILFVFLWAYVSFSLLQLNALSGENKRLRRQLEEERSMRLHPPPPTSQQCSSVHLPFSLRARPPPPSTSTSLPSSLRPPHPLSLDTATRDIEGILTQTELSQAVLERPGESRALGEAFWIRPTASVSLEDARSGRTSRDLTKWSPLKTLTCHDFSTSSSSPGSALSMRLMSCRSKSSPRMLFAWGVLQNQRMMEFHQINSKRSLLLCHEDIYATNIFTFLLNKIWHIKVKQLDVPSKRCNAMRSGSEYFFKYFF